ncbi:MAG: hypothetical protein RBR82_17390, partial [Pseudomonas sp.]|nr:hypothetical protein [Pseudomonas sp.]
PTAGAVAYGTGSAYAFTSAGTSGQVLTSGGTGAPTWTNLSGIGVTSVTGTANQITASPTTGAVVLSLPTDLRAPGTFNATTSIATGTGAGTVRIDDSGNLTNIGTIATTGEITIGGDVVLSRGAANRLDLASGDSLNLVSGSLQVAGTQVITSGRIIRAGNGTAAAPALSFSSDTNTGIYRGGADILGFSTAGAARMSILANGNVGIGTTSPAYLLDVAGDINTTGTYRMAGIDYGQYFIDSAGTNGQVWKSDGSGRGYWGVDDTGTALPAGTSGQTIRHDGSAWVANSLLYNDGTNIGIGTTSPGAKLSVNTDTGSYPTMELKYNDTKVVDIFSNASSNIFIGLDSGSNISSGAYNTGYGYQSLYSNTTGSQNVATGNGALRNNTTGGGNVASGYAALPSNTEGSYNTAIGRSALSANTTGNYNVASGNQALYRNTTGSSNIAIGASALQTNVAKQGSTAIGHQAMLYAHNIATAGLTYNTAIGHQALRGSTTPANNSGTYNTALGANAGLAMTSGSNNTLVGYNAGSNLTTGGSNIIIGSGITAPSATGSNQLNIGNTIYGNTSTGRVGIGTTAPSTLLQLGQAGTAGTLGIAGSTSGLVTLQTAAAAGTWTMTLPTGTGTSGQVLTTNGSGVTSWTSPISSIKWNAIDNPDGHQTLTMGTYNTTWNFTSGAFRITNNSTEALYVGGGNVGIGTTSPSYKLDVNGDLRAEKFLDYTNPSYYLDPAAAGTSMLVAGNVGIGTTAPATKLHIAGDGGILAQGTYGSGWDGGSLGAGSRLMWIPSKSAFRAGYVNGTQWNTANIGNYSVAMGNNTIASGDYSTAMGDGTEASGWQSVAMGSLTIASGWNSMAMGLDSIASGYFSAAFGESTNAIGEGSFAAGLANTAGGYASIAMGGDTTASGDYSTALGGSSNASGFASTALGGASTASGDHSTALGHITTAQAYASTVLGRYNEIAGSTTAWNASDPVFAIGIGSSASNRANAMTVLKDGNVGIGTTNPGAKLSVNTSSYPTIELKYNDDKVAHIFSNVASNIFIGLESGSSISSGTYNVGYGYQSLYSNTTGSQNVATGNGALRNNTTGGGNV